MPKSSNVSYKDKRKIVTAITERRLEEDFNTLLKEFKVSSSTFYAWREEVTTAMEKNRKINSYKKKGKPTSAELSFSFKNVDMTLETGIVTFEDAEVTIVGKDVFFNGKGVIRRD